MILKQKTFKTPTGSVEVYGYSGGLGYGSKRDSTKIGLYVVRKPQDCNCGCIESGASTELTPNQAREVAKRLVAWANTIEGNK